ncbi:hypothetical protein [Amycolatopsis nigrescens]|uniref:hypothetical protein n=1 Tax=Amycolatopsis nigrescens TaxID=381445 RepID=UPI00037853C8|nr:hypothetical protein [Amycolatopsis nigrescens]
MRVVLGTNAFAAVGGSETYVLTIAVELQRLGHEVTIHAAELGAMAELAVAQGIAVAPELDDLPAHCDVVLAQDGGMAYALADRLPKVPQVFVAHGTLFDLSMPPLVPGVAKVVVVLSDSVGRRVRALDVPQEVVRLRQPIDVDRLVPRGAPRPRPKRVLLLGNYLQSDVRRVLVDAWSPAGLEFVQVGRATASLRPEEEIAAADIVVGKGRALLDAMSCGRPAYLYDVFGTDGWVTPGSYPLMEADAFAGQALPVVGEPGRLRRDLDAYDPLMGQVNRELVLNHHQAHAHAEELVALFQRLAPAAAPVTTAHRELARLVRLRWRDECALYLLRAEFAVFAERTGAELERTRSALAVATARATESERRYEESERLRAEGDRAREAAEIRHAQERRATQRHYEQQERLLADALNVAGESHQRELEAVAELADQRAITGQRRVRLDVVMGQATDRVRGLLRR